MWPLEHASEENRPPLRERVAERLRRARRWTWEKVVVVAAVLLVLLGVWGAMDLDRRIRAGRHDGETWADLETWAHVELEESVLGPSEDSRRLVMDLWVRTLRARDLAFPVEDVEQEDLRDDFHDSRSGGRTHEALDIFAPKGTKVLAVEDGVVVRVSKGGLGGRYVMLEDPTGTFRYYYAHLERWVWGLDEGDRVERGQTLGYVGSTGNASADVPHLHFAIYKVISGRRGSGVPVNPWRIFVGEEDDEMPGPTSARAGPSRRDDGLALCLRGEGIES